LYNFYKGYIMIKRFLLLLTLALAVVMSTATADDTNKSGDEVQYKSELSMPPTFGPNATSFPEPFSALSNTRTQPAVSTGYYFVDSYETLAPYGDSFWHPFPTIEDTNNTIDGQWIRILPGPRTLDFPDATAAANYWKTNVNGHHYFRNPAYPSTGSFFEHGITRATDSTDDAFAGPMPLNLTAEGFIFNGVRYDSFYVSTNGLIALTNRRYLYDGAGNRTIGGNGDCYDRMSMDWFVVGSFGRSRTGASSTTSLNDPAPDNFGYQYSVMFNSQFSAQGGIRQRGGSLNAAFNNTYRAAVIAPFFGDCQLSQYWATVQRPDDFGKVYFKKYNDGNKLVIYFVNIAPIRTLTGIPGVTYTGPIDSRPGETNHVSASAQVVLNRLDSSITIQYEIFTGFVPLGSYGTAAAQHVFLYNTSCGVLGWGRHVNNYKAKNSASYQEYVQYTHYFSKFLISPAMDYPASGMAVKFKQWKNTLRVLTISYRVRSTDKNKSLDFTEAVPTSLVDNFELLAGEERIGAIQPVAVIQNLTNDITEVDVRSPGAPNKADYPGTGINSIRQDLNFRARFRIYNQAMDKIIYNRLMPIDSTGIFLPNSYDAQSTYFGNPYSKVRHVTVALSGSDYKTTDVTSLTGLNGIPPYGFVEVYFPPFEPNEFVQDKYKNFTNIGRMKAEVECDPTDPRNNEVFGDQWPADNKLYRFLFVMKRLTSFADDVTEWHRVKADRDDMTPTSMPSVEKWVNIGTQAVVGDEASHHPLPPRKESGGTLGFRNKNWMYEGIGQDRLNSPVIKMNRKTLSNQEYVPIGQWGGDEIRSFPIDMRGRLRAVLSVSAQRTTNPPSKVYNRGFSDGTIVGCEPRAVLNSDLNTIFATVTNSVALQPDELVVELSQSSPDQIHGITNIGVALPYIATDKRGSWRYHPRRGGAAPITNMAAIVLYGAGGSMRGFLEKDKDSALTTVTGLRATYFDDGFDESFQKMFIAIPDTFIKAPNEGAKNFRFRVRVNATNDQKRQVPPSIPDDDDDMYVDNVTILFPSEQTDIEVSSVDITWPYTVVPHSQAKKIPIRVKISNNTSVAAPSFFVKVMVFLGTADNIQDKKAIYCKRIEMPFLSPGDQIEVTMPDWDATLAAVKNNSQNFHIKAIARIPGGDLEIKNDTTYYDINLKFGEYFAYDLPSGTTNSVSAANGGNGRGLSLEGYSFGGIGSATSYQVYPTDPAAFGANGGSSSGQIAMKFELFQVDTIIGYQAFFGIRNAAPDYITFSIYNDQNGRPQGQPVTNSMLERVQRGKDDIRKDYFYDQYVTYLLKEPLILPRGKYWASIAQLGQTGMELGATDNRMGMRTMNVHIRPPIYTVREVGLEGSSLMVHKEFREYDNYNNLMNNNIFAYENTFTSGAWRQFMPTTGAVGYAHLHHFGLAPGDDYYTWTLTRGTWNPFLRPYLGVKYPESERKYEECYDDIPVELTSFNGKAREEGIDLFWETASEINNFGFYVERRDLDNDGQWKDVSFIKGKGTSSNINRYSYFDNNVVLNNTYEYRLKQVDLDGNKDCGTYSQTIRVKFAHDGLLVLSQNIPNPFSEFTMLSFTLPEKTRAKLEVLDLFGNVLRTIVDEELNASTYNYNWDRLCNNGTYAPNGTYIYRLTAGDAVRTGKMTLVR
jgi:hypothetical protein